jgi:hypothetical protein
METKAYGCTGSRHTAGVLSFSNRIDPALLTYRSTPIPIVIDNARRVNEEE